MEADEVTKARMVKREQKDELHVYPAAYAWGEGEKENEPYVYMYYADKSSEKLYVGGLDGIDNLIAVLQEARRELADVILPREVKKTMRQKARGERARAKREKEGKPDPDALDSLMTEVNA